MPSDLNCLIFDFDGVIADTDLSRFKLLQKLLKPYGIDLSKKYELSDIIGISTKAFLSKKINSLNENQIEDIIKKRHNLYLNNLNDYCIPFDGMKELIKLYSRSYELVIVTTNSLETVSPQLKYLDIIDCFKWIIGNEICEDKNLVKTYKPIKNIINKLISSCIVIEDSDVGVKAAREEGYYCIRFDPYRRFQKTVENYRVSNYEELNTHIKEYTNRQ
jgi:beta-phosphoglucomutase-like phosphatase (HAD superfamily)